MTEYSNAFAAVTYARLAAMTTVEYERGRDAEAKALGVRVSKLDEEVERLRREQARVQERETGSAPAFSDEGLTQQFAKKHKDDFRFVAAWVKWFVRKPDRWCEDTTLEVISRVRVFVTEAAAECGDSEEADRIASAKTIAAVERLARADRAFAATVEQWNRDPWVLNTPAGVIDLRTGVMRRHRADDYLTKITAVAPSGDCPMFHSFLDRITGGSSDLKAYLQRVFGYCLTGSVEEHSLFFGHGTGANGKGTLLGAVGAVLGDYHTVAQMETFTGSSKDRHPTDLAALHGARLVTAQETEEGRHWNESRIKAITGGDPITARFMRQDFFTYAPQFKLFAMGNHKPHLRSVDKAISRRFNLVPFRVQIPDDEVDHELPEKLKAEWAGVLAWLIEGCRLWQMLGLEPPAIIVDATAEYLNGEDAIALWISERCRVPGQWHAKAGLYASWKDWAEGAGETVGSMNELSKALETRGFVSKRKAKTGARGFEGIEVAFGWVGDSASESEGSVAAEGEKL